MNHFWALIQAEKLTPLIADTTLSLIGTLARPQATSWPNHDPHALVVEQTPGVVKIQTALRDVSASEREFSIGLARVQAREGLATDQAMSAWTVRLVLPETLFARLYGAEAFGATGPDYLTYRHQIYTHCQQWLRAHAPLVASVVGATPTVSDYADLTAPERILALDLTFSQIAPLTPIVLQWLVDLMWFSLSQELVGQTNETEVNVLFATMRRWLQTQPDSQKRLANLQRLVLQHAHPEDRVSAPTAVTSDFVGFDGLDDNSATLLLAAVDLGFGYAIIDGAKGFVQISGDGVSRLFVHGSLGETTNAAIYTLTQHKHALKTILATAGFPVARGQRFHDANQAMAAFEASFANKSIVIKPDAPSRGMGVACFLIPPTRSDFARAVQTAQQHGDVLIELFSRGSAYHFSLIGGRVVNVLETVAANVVGDGRQTIQMLIKQKNRTRTARRQITVDDTVLDRLRDQHATLDTIPARGQQLWLQQAAHPFTGGDVYEVTREIDASYVTLAEQIAAHLHLSTAAIDLMIANLYQTYEQDRPGQAIVLGVDANPNLTVASTPDMGEPYALANRLLQNAWE